MKVTEKWSRIALCAAFAAVLVAVSAMTVMAAEDEEKAFGQTADCIEAAEASEEIKAAEAPEEEPAEEEYTVSTVVFLEDGRVILPRPVKEGKIFVEWNTKKDGGGQSYKAGETVDPYGLFLYSIWNDETDEIKEEEQAAEDKVVKETEIINDTEAEASAEVSGAEVTEESGTEEKTEEKVEENAEEKAEEITQAEPSGNEPVAEVSAEGTSQEAEEGTEMQEAAGEETPSQEAIPEQSENIIEEGAAE